MDPEHSASLPSSLPYGRSTVDSTKILISHKDKDSLCHTNISSGDVTVEEYNTGKPEPCSVSGRRGSAGQAHNIPYMQHFHHLKQKFPDLRDCDINESIQKYGLDLARCEAELQRAQSHSSGYYGPWGRGHLSSRSSPTTTPTRNASLTSPNTPTLSPYSSPFSSQVLPSPLTMASSRSTPKLFSPKTSSNTPGSKETISVPQCSPSTCCAPSSLATPSPVAYASSLMPSLATTAGPAVYPPSSILTVASNSYNSHNSYENQNLFTSPIHNGSSLARVPSSQADPYHTAITRHYIGTSVYHNTNDPFCRQYSNSSETITEESSIMGSNIPSPAPTLTFSSPQSPLVSPPVHNHCADMPDLSRLLEQLPISQSASNQQQFRQPINPFLPPWNQGNEQTSNRPTLSNAQMPPYVDNDTPYNPTREQTARSARSTSSANRENNPAAVYFSRPPERSNSGDKLAADPSEVRRRRPNFQSPLEPVRIAPPPPVLASGNIGPAHQISRLTDLQLCTVPPSSSSPCVPPPLPPSSSTAAGLNQTPPAKIDNRKGLLEDQRARQQRMLAVLTEGTRDRTCLQEEVTKLSLSLEESRQKGIADASRSAKIIHDIQEENRRLQSECDRMEGDILETDEAPDLVETGYGASFSNPREGPSYSLSSPSSPLPARPQQLNRGVSVGRGVGEGAQRFTPTRVAPPPPVSSGYTAATSSAPPQFPSGGYDPPMQQQAGGSSTARWSCNRCTYDNHPDMTACEICGAMRMPPSPHTPAGGFSRPSLGTEDSIREFRCHAGQVHDVPDVRWCEGANLGSFSQGAQTRPSLGTEDSIKELRCHAGQIRPSLGTEDSYAGGELRYHDAPDGRCGEGANPGSFFQGAELKGCFSWCGRGGTARASSGDRVVDARQALDDPSQEFDPLSGGDLCKTANLEQGFVCSSGASDASAGVEISVGNTYPDVNLGGLDVAAGETQCLLNKTTDVDDRCSSDSSTKERTSLGSTHTKTSSATGSYDDLEVFSFVTGISHGSWNTPRSRNSFGCSVSPSLPSHDQSECFCHPRRRSEVLGHRRTGSGGSAAALNKTVSFIPMGQQRNSSSLSRLSVRPRDDAVTGSGSRSSSGINEIISRSVVNERSANAFSNSSSANHLGSNNLSAGSSEGGGSRSFGYDTAPLAGYPAALYYSARLEDADHHDSENVA